MRFIKNCQFQVEVCCSSLVGTGLAVLGSHTNKTLSPQRGIGKDELPITAEMEDFDDMRDGNS